MRRLRVSQAIRKAVFDPESLTPPDQDDLSIERLEGRSNWVRAFNTPKGEEIDLRIFDKYEDDVWDVEFQGDEGYDPSDSGEQWYVFNMILRFIKQFIDERLPKAIRIQGWTDKQHKLYRKMLNRLFPPDSDDDEYVVSEQGRYLFLHQPGHLPSPAPPEEYPWR